MLEKPLTTLAVVCALLLPLGSGLFRVWVNRDMVAVGYQLSEQSRLRHRLRQREKQLEVELAAQKSPARLKKLALKFAMAPPTASQIIAAPVLKHHTTNTKSRREIADGQ